MNKINSQHLLTAVFLVFILGLSISVFVPSLTAAVTVGANVTAQATIPPVNGIHLALLWAVPVMAIIAAIMLFSYKSIGTARTRD